VGRSKKKEKFDDGRIVVGRNRRALHDYEILDRLEVGMVLLGSEVKSLREGHISLVDAYAQVLNGELWLLKANISLYINATHISHDPERKRKLLAHRHEIKRLAVKVKEKGLTLVPLMVYFREGRAKLELALARGKSEHGRKEDVAERDRQRSLRAARKDRGADI
jgi:SsrA-binding protein